MTFLMGLILRSGVSARFAKPLLALLAFLALAGLTWAAIAHHDWGAIKAHDATANAAVIAKTTPANDRAANQRATDTIALNTQAQETRDAIHATPDSAPGPSSVMLGCNRLRRQGKNLASVPACARLASGH